MRTREKSQWDMNEEWRVMHEGTKNSSGGKEREVTKRGRKLATIMDKL